MYGSRTGGIDRSDRRCWRTHGAGWGRARWTIVLGLGLLVVACSDGPPDAEEGAREPIGPAETMADSIQRLFDSTYARAEVTVYEDSVPSCGRCELRLVPVGRFGDLDDRYLLRDLPLLVERDSRGRFYATVHGAADQELILYESDGTVVRQVGRPGGSGPGEFLRGVTSLLVGPGDSLHVVHDAVMVSVFDSAGTHLRTSRLGTGTNVPPTLLNVDEYGYLVAFRGIVSPGAVVAGYRLHRFAHDGTHLESFGRPGLTDLQMALRAGTPLIAGPTGAWRGRDGGVWLLHGLYYRLERIDHRGEVDRVIGVRPPPRWHMLLSLDLQDVGGVIKLPDGRLKGFHELNTRLGIAVINVPSEEWESVQTRPHHRYSDEGRLIAIEQYQEVWDAVLDVIDLETGKVLARKRLPRQSFLTRDGTLYSVYVDELGVISVEAFEVEFLEG